MFACPCCGFLTLPTRTDWDLCPVCFWEDDPSQAADESDPAGANGLSLQDARTNYALIGAIHESFIDKVRAPEPQEIPGALL